MKIEPKKTPKPFRFGGEISSDIGSEHMLIGRE
jgi:hypothetical protein